MKKLRDLFDCDQDGYVICKKCKSTEIRFMLTNVVNFAQRGSSYHLEPIEDNAMIGDLCYENAAEKPNHVVACLECYSGSDQQWPIEDISKLMSGD